LRRANSRADGNVIGGALAITLFGTLGGTQRSSSAFITKWSRPSVDDRFLLVVDGVDDSAIDLSW